MREVMFLGHWDRGDGQIGMDKQKVKAIEEWGVPVTELRSFLGLLNEIFICIFGRRNARDC